MSTPDLAPWQAPDINMHLVDAVQRKEDEENEKERDKKKNVSLLFE